MDIDPKVAIHAFLNELATFREDLKARQDNLEASYQGLAADLQPCTAAFRTFQNAAEEWGKTGGALARIISEILLDSLPASRDKET